MSLLSKYINRQLAAYQSELVQTHYQEVENMYRQIRGWRHDYRNHIQVLKSYAKDGDLAQISKYLDELDEDLSTVDTVIKTGNKMTDAILNSKISLAKSKHIPVVADAHVPVALKHRRWISALSLETSSTMRLRRACNCRKRSA